MIKNQLLTRRQFAALTVGLTSALAVAGCNAQTVQTQAVAQINPKPAPNAQKPNVLIILADDLGWSDIGVMGGEISTPNIDALAGSGLTFTDFYNTPRCSPTRASLLTGLYPHQAGVPGLGQPISKNAVTIPEILDGNGYATSMVGKWHLSEQSTPVDRGFQEFYGMLGGFNSYWEEHPYQIRLPAGHPAIDYKPGQYYSTNAFGDYSIDFIDQGKRENKPWFQYLAFNAAHFPLHAPADVIDKYDTIYQKGWDEIRAERLARQKKLGLVPQNLELTPRSEVPKNFINVQTGWADKENPAWNTLPADRQKDLARRMATYAAAIEVMDRNIGRVVAHLKETGQYDNTLIFFLSDNGACAEWDPFGFDKLDSPLNILHKGDDLKQIGAPGSYVSYGSGWANASNTPWRLYKHYAEEGGIRTPLIVHWPNGLTAKPGTRTSQPGSLIDIMPTVLQVSGAKYPDEFNGFNIIPEQGVSLVPTFGGATLPARPQFIEHEGNRMVREGDWKLVAIHDRPWELYNLAQDPTEMRDQTAAQPARAKKMAADWETWAQNSMVIAKPSPQLVNKALTISADVTTNAQNGVIVAQGGRERGYVVYLQDGVPNFGVRQNQVLSLATATQKVPTGKFSVEARLDKTGAMTLKINGKTVATGKAPGVFTTQPTDGLSVGEDTMSAVGEYTAPFSLRGKVENVKVETK